MTEREIIFNYRQAMKQAERLDDLSKRLERMSRDKMANAIGQLKGAWQSDNSSQYYSKVGKVQEEIKTTAGDVRQIAQAIRTTAEAVKNAELRALEIARSRTYK